MLQKANHMQLKLMQLFENFQHRLLVGYKFLHPRGGEKCLLYTVRNIHLIIAKTTWQN